MANRDVDSELGPTVDDGGAGRRARNGPGAVASGLPALLQLQMTAGNQAVASLVAAGGAGAPAPPPLSIQRDVGDQSQAQGSAGDGSAGAAAPACAGPKISVDTSGLGQTVDGTSPDSGQVGQGTQSDQVQPVQTLPVQRTPGQGGGGGSSAASTPAPVPTVSWNDFADGDESNSFAAQSAWTFGFSGGFTVSEDSSSMWAKPSVKTDTTNGPALLRHEQYHYNLAGVMAGKATQAQGQRPTNQGDFNRLVATTNRHTGSYDAETRHGLDASSQAAWESRIDSGNLAFP